MIGARVRNDDYHDRLQITIRYHEGSDLELDNLQKRANCWSAHHAHNNGAYSKLADYILGVHVYHAVIHQSR